MQLPLQYVANKHFPAWLEDKRKEDEVLGPMPKRAGPPETTQRPSLAYPYGADLNGFPVLTHQQEAHLFRKMNYLKYKANLFRMKFNPLQPQEALMTHIENLYDEIVAVRNQIVSANLRLVVSIAKRQIELDREILDLISDGNMSLMRAVERFDYSLGNKFSTYATRAIMNQFARTFHLALRQHNRFRTNQSNVFTATLDVRCDHCEFDGARASCKGSIDGILRRLNERERKIIVRRFGLQNGRQPQTLKQVSEVLGVSKERVRQIQARAIQKLRQAAVQDRLCNLAEV
jgi:RNA polymerase primary sigma factor/RNA polymerase sigma factor